MNLLSLIQEHVQLRHYRAGDYVLHQGDETGFLYVIQEGEVDVRVDDRYVRTLGKGEIFGEMALIDGSPHSADIVARIDCTVAPVDERRFLFLVHENPLFALHILRLMAQRLRR